jgi:hypothetical protein
MILTVAQRSLLKNISSSPKKSVLSSTSRAENSKRSNTGRLGVLRPDLGSQEALTTKEQDHTTHAGEILKGGGWVMYFRLRERKMGEWGNNRIWRICARGYENVKICVSFQLY